MEDVDGAAVESHPDAQHIAALTREKESMRVEFDAQRAKLKELYLQKEEELKTMKVEKESMGKQLEQVTSESNDLKSQLLVAGLQLETNVETEKRKAAEEIASLQQLIHETFEESSTLRNEVRKQQSVIQHLEGQIHDLKQHSPHHTVQESTSLAPSLMLSAVTKKIGKKLGADFFTSQDDDHREDHELLKTLIGPLEEEIKALKDKLRATDEELQRCKAGGDVAPPPTDARDSGGAGTCDMCRNYEDELVGEQKRVTALELKVLAAEKSAERHKEDLLKEIGFRKDMEEKWNEKREEHRLLVDALSARLEAAERDVRAAGDACAAATAAMRDDVARLGGERERVQRELERLQRDNDNLVGRYSLHSQALQNEFIDLPNTVDDLQEAMLRLKQDLIEAKIGKEVAEEAQDKLSGENIMLREQILSDQQNAKMQKDNLETELKNLHVNVEKYKAREKDALAKYQEKCKQYEGILEIKAENQELRSRVQSFKQELTNSVTVQKDFVRLSQNLQVQLEEIRAADTQVRWQHDEDVDECPGCRARFAPLPAPTVGGALASTGRGPAREHCRHCGQIFCGACLTHEVRSGPALRASKVCDVCHTLLDKSSAPYFSTEAPHSPG